MLVSKEDRKKYILSGVGFEYIVKVEDEHFELFNLAFLMQRTCGPIKHY